MSNEQLPSPTSRLTGLTDLVGSEVGASDWKRIDQAAINAFADLTDDGGAIHTDPAAATTCTRVR